MTAPRALMAVVRDVVAGMVESVRRCAAPAVELLFVTGYPMAKRPFYTHPRPDDPTVSNSFDLQRLHRYEDYVTALAGSDLAPLEGYLEAFRHGMPPDGGFAIGLERWVARLTGAANVREVTLFPRDLHRLTP